MAFHCPKCCSKVQTLPAEDATGRPSVFRLFPERGLTGSSLRYIGRAFSVIIESLSDAENRQPVTREY